MTSSPSGSGPIASTTEQQLASDRPGRYLLANLDAEARWNSPGDAALSPAAGRRASRLGTLLRVFFSPEDPQSPLSQTSRRDVLWLPDEPVDLGVTPIGPQPEFRFRQLPSLTERDQVRFWLADPDRVTLPNSHRALSVAGSRSLPWRCAVPSSFDARRTSDRAFLLELRRSLDLDSGHGEWVKTSEEVTRAVAQHGSVVLKAPYTAAGRHRLGVTSNTRPSQIDAFIERSHRPNGDAGAPGLLLEPWLQRTGDFGVVGWIVEDGPVEIRCHRLEVNPAGAFTGIAALRPEDPATQRLESTFRKVADTVRKSNYRGPLGIDSFTYRATDAQERWIDVCEVNGRLTFGHVAHAWAESLGRPLARFSIAKAPPPLASTMECLLNPTPTDPVGAWIELQPE